MKEGWKIKRLEDVVSILDSKRKPISQRDRIAGPYPYYGATGILDFVENYLFDEKLILVGEDGAKWLSGDQTAFFAEGRYWVNNHAHVMRPERSIVCDNWIVFFLNYSDLTPFITGLTVPKLNQEKLRSIELPIPPLPEQKRIVAILDEAFAAIDQAKANVERNLQNSKDLFQSKLNRIFSQKGEGWVEKRLGDELRFLNGFAFKSNDAIENSSTQLIRMGNLYRNLIDLSRSPVYYPDSFCEAYTKYLLREGDIILSLTGTAGKRDYGYAVLVPKSVNHLLMNQRICKLSITVGGSLSTSFLFWYLRSEHFLSMLFNSSTGTRQGNLSTETLRNIPIWYPQKLAQFQICSTLDVLSVQSKNLENQYKQKLTSLESLKKSILEKAFKGELKTSEIEAAL